MIAFSQRVAQITLSLALMFGLVLPVPAQQEIPQVISYQGFLRDGANAPVTGTVNLTMKLYEAISGGTEVWSETHTGVSVTEGVFSIALGSGPTTSFNAAGLVFDKALFLGITVNTDAEMTPRLPLTTSPYAFAAKVAIFNMSVDCTAQQPGETPIADALFKAPAGGALIITLNGICNEHVSVGRDLVRFVAANPPATPVKDGGIPTDGIRGTLDNDAALRVRGASDISLFNIVLEGGSLDVAAARFGVIVQKNGSVYLENVLLTNSYAGALANRGGFLHLFETQVAGNSVYGVQLTDAGNARIEDSNVIHHVTRTNNDESAVAAYRQNNIRFRGNNQIINAGNDGEHDASNPDAAANDDNGFSLSIYHGVQVRQDGGHSVFVGKVDAGNQVQISLRDPQLVGDINLGNNSLMELRNSTTADAELMARSINVTNGSYLTFGRDNITLTVTGQASTSGHSRIAIFRDSIASSFGSLVVSSGSEIALGGPSSITNNVDLFSHSTLNIYDANLATIDDTLVTVGGSLKVGQFSILQMSDTASLRVANQIGFFQHSEFHIDNAIVSSASMKIGPLVSGNLNNEAEIIVGTPVGDDPTTLGDIEMYSHNQLHINANTAVIGNLRAGALSFINVNGPAAEHKGNISIDSGVTPGVLNIFSPFTVIDGDVDCNGAILDGGTVNRIGPPNGTGSVTFAGVSPGSFVNCP